jgi:hypothetical protein
VSFRHPSASFKKDFHERIARFETIKAFNKTLGRDSPVLQDRGSKGDLSSLHVRQIASIYVAY